MGVLVRGIVLGTIGAVVAIPALIILAVFGVPLFFVGAALLGVFVAVPFIVLAALAIPFFVLFAVIVVGVLVAAVLALKVALFVVLPILLVALAVSWIVRHSQARRYPEYV